MGVYGFSINGVHSSTFGLIVRSVNRTILPAIRQNYQQISGRHGTYDYSDRTLDDRIIEIECDFMENTMGDLRVKSRRLAAWLYSLGKKSKIKFDDESTLYYLGKPANQIDLEQFMTIGTFKLQFRCDPFVYYDGYADSPVNDHNIPLFAQVADSDTYTFSVGSSPQSVTVNNYGHIENPFTLEITGGVCSTLSIRTLADNKILNYTEAIAAGQKVTIDMDKMTADKDGINKLSVLTGDFLTLPVGYSQVTLSGTGLNSVTPLSIHFKIQPRFI